MNERHVRHGSDEPTKPSSPVSDRSRRQFGRRLQGLLDERGWSQADLVRRVTEVTGQKIGRDAVSTYVNGRSLPNGNSLSLLSEAFGLSRQELLADDPAGAAFEDPDGLELRMAPGQPGKALLRLNRLLTFETAAKIVQLINQEDTQQTKEGD